MRFASPLTPQVHLVVAPDEFKGSLSAEQVAACIAAGAGAAGSIEVVLDVAGFEDRSAEADLVITGEGSFDVQSLEDKTPVGVAARVTSGRSWRPRSSRERPPATQEGWQVGHQLRCRATICA